MIVTSRGTWGAWCSGHKDQVCKGTAVWCCLALSMNICKHAWSCWSATGWEGHVEKARLNSLVSWGQPVWNLPMPRYAWILWKHKDVWALKRESNIVRFISGKKKKNHHTVYKQKRCVWCAAKKMQEERTVRPWWVTGIRVVRNICLRVTLAGISSSDWKMKEWLVWGTGGMTHF